MRKRKALAMVILISVLFVFSSAFEKPTVFSEEPPPTESPAPQQVSANNALEILQDLAEYSPRLFGSGSANDEAIGAVYDAAMYIKQKLESYGLETKVEEFTTQDDFPWQFDAWQYSNYRLIIDYDGDLATTGDRIDLTDQSTPFLYGWWADDPYGLTLLNMEITGTIRHDTDDNLVLSSPTPNTWEEDFKLGATNILFGFPAMTSTDAAYSSKRFGTITLERPLFESVEGQVVDDTSLVIFNYRMEKKTLTGYNVIGKIEGDSEQEVILTAHYDTVYTDGAIDNGSGVATLLEVARKLADYHFQHDIYFVFVDGEEFGLLGSQDYVRDHADEMSDAIANINVDCVASGSDGGMTIGVELRYPEVWADLWWGFQQVSTPEIDDFVSNIALETIGFDPGPFYPEYVGGGGTDFASFASEGIPATSIFWLDLVKSTTYPGISDQQLTEDYEYWKTVGGTDYYYLPGSFHINLPYIHTSYDDLAHVNVQYLADTIKVVTQATFRLAGGIVKIYLPLIVKGS
jgi:hypothetical protein